MMLLASISLSESSSKGVPLLVEIPVHDDTAPFLITSTKSLLWINQSFNGVVRSAVRSSNWKTESNQFQLDVVRSVRDQSLRCKWGNVLPNTPKGISQAEEYLRSYEMPVFELLTHSETTSWVPDGSALLVPKDRLYLGVVAFITPDAYTVVLHNPSRGMVVLGDW